MPKLMGRMEGIIHSREKGVKVTISYEIQLQMLCTLCMFMPMYIYIYIHIHTHIPVHMCFDDIYLLFSAYWATAVHSKYQYLWIFRYVYSIVIYAYGYVIFGCLHVYQMHQVWCVRALRYKNQDFYSHIVSTSICVYTFIIINLCIYIYPCIHIYIYSLYLPIYVCIYIQVSMYIIFYRLYIYYTYYACLA